MWMLWENAWLSGKLIRTYIAQVHKRFFFFSVFCFYSISFFNSPNFECVATPLTRCVTWWFVYLFVLPFFAAHLPTNRIRHLRVRIGWQPERCCKKKSKKQKRRRRRNKLLTSTASELELTRENRSIRWKFILYLRWTCSRLLSIVTRRHSWRLECLSCAKAQFY